MNLNTLLTFWLAKDRAWQTLDRKQSRTYTNELSPNLAGVLEFIRHGDPDTRVIRFIAGCKF